MANGLSYRASGIFARMLTSCVIGFLAGAALLNAAFYVGPLRALLVAFRQNPPAGTSAPAGVSVVIAARNEAGNLRAYLPEVLAQAYSADWEVVVANDDSADSTATMLAGLATQHPQLKTLNLPGKQRAGKKLALAAAIETASEAWLLTTDADCRPTSRHWMATMLGAREPATEIVLGYAPYGKTSGVLNAWIRFEAAYTAMQYLSAALLGRAYMGVGRNLLYSRALYGRLGGFAAHAHLASGDDDLLVNAGATADNVAICLSPAAWVYSEAESTWPAYFHQKRRHLSVGRAYRNRDQYWLGLLGASQAGLYVGLLAATVMGEGWVALGIYSVRAFLVAPRMMRAMRGLGVGDLCWSWPLIDAGLAAYYGFGVISLLRAPAPVWSAGRSAR